MGAVCILLVACSCARRGMPPGGPVDTDPPRIVAVVPDSGQARVEDLSEVCITFTEQMDKRSVKDMVLVRPTLKIRDTHWRKNTFCVSLAESLSSSATYVFTVMSGSKDAHGNYLKAPYVFTFSRADTVMSGRIEGTVRAKNLPVAGIQVWAFDSVSCPQPDFSKDQPQYVAQSGSDGKYGFLGLPSGTYLLYGFKDKNANRAYDQDSDFTSPAEKPIWIDSDFPVLTGVDIYLVDPSEPGGITGVVLHCIPDSIRMIVTAASVADSLALFTAPVGRDSVFLLKGMPPGRYGVSAFADLDDSRDWQPESEPSSPDTHVIEVIPGETIKGVKLEIPCTKPPEPDETGEKAPEEGLEETAGEALEGGSLSEDVDDEKEAISSENQEDSDETSE